MDSYERRLQESIILSTHVQLAPSTVQLWHKKLHDGSTAVALVNFGVFDGQHYNATFTSEMVRSSANLAPRTRATRMTVFLQNGSEQQCNCVSGRTGARNGV